MLKVIRDHVKYQLAPMVIYIAEAGAHVHRAQLAGDFEQASAFRPPMEVRGISLTQYERLYLEVALALRATRYPAPDG